MARKSKHDMDKMLCLDWNRGIERGSGTDQQIEHAGEQDGAVPAEARVGGECADERQHQDGPGPRVRAGGRGRGGHAQRAGQVRDQVALHAAEPDALHEADDCMYAARSSSEFTIRRLARRSQYGERSIGEITDDEQRGAPAAAAVGWV